ncbi:hypothetical protein SISNIDRAFT_450238 [Sistotremastrum niveocremeum HHB9708]|uniref:U4/U6 snRNA-associated-splicing factor PRP24 n=1 Tax=Sistotremastrum niveocremeum HHB9708 TaxID=1314777 RepID=A0A164Z1D1_9AGAM|nr:hypothetical protein SISNIDRAFT_450238 [Sistotremastrum niveocremeum HHB9708]
MPSPADALQEPVANSSTAHDQETAQSTDEDALLTQLSSLLTDLTANPLSLRLHKAHLSLSKQLGLDLDQARELLIENRSGPSALWLDSLRETYRSLGPETDDEDEDDNDESEDEGWKDVERVEALFQQFARAHEDYLFIPILILHAKSLLRAFRAGVLDAEDIRSRMEEIMEKANKFISGSQEVWSIWRAWEMERLDSVVEEGGDKEILVAHINDLHLNRLRTPHAQHSETLDSYSQFISSTHPPSSYESLLVTASKIKTHPARIYSRRENFEFVPTGATVDWGRYIGFEKKKIDLPLVVGVYERAVDDLATRIWNALPDSPLTSEKADEDSNVKMLEDELAKTWLGYIQVVRDHSPPDSKKAGNDDEEAQEGDDDEPSPTDREHRLFARAVRSAPFSGTLWAAYIIALERSSLPTPPSTDAPDSDDGNEDDVQIPDYVAVHPQILLTYSRALAALTSSSAGAKVDDLIDVILARFSYERRRIDFLGGGLDELAVLLEEAIEQIRALPPTAGGKSGDSRLRVERAYSNFLASNEDADLEKIQKLWEGTTKHFNTSYFAWISYAEALTKVGAIQQARQVYQSTLRTRSLSLDYPEPLFDAYRTFEALYGSVKDEEEGKVVLAKASEGVARKREKEARIAYEKAEKERQDYWKAYAEAAASTNGAAVKDAGYTEDAEGEAEKLIGSALSMDVDTSINGTAKKRKADDLDDEGSQAGGGYKKAKTEKEVVLKRDRENCTVFVSDLPESASDGDLEKLFKDCGPIREVKITRLEGKDGADVVATVEFMSRDSIPPALTKDKKRLPPHENELNVHPAWQSTLYITNFPPSANDEQIREMFAAYGPLFDVRWPSKKWKGTRRFCYVQFVKRESARASLALHGTEMEPGMKLSVLISNPERKKERSDKDADRREVYVAGLARSTTEDDLRGIFDAFGAIKEIRIASDEKGCKGFAFVEFESEEGAEAALGANNVELKKRRIAVTLADSRVQAKPKRLPTATGLGKKAEVRSKSVRIKGLPEAAEEGLLQQAVEKAIGGPVKRVEVFRDLREGVVELETLADAGKIVLLPSPVVFQGHELQIVEESVKPPNRKERRSAAARGGSVSVGSVDGTPEPGATASGSTAATASGGGGMFVPRAAGKPKAKLGLGAPRAAAGSAAPKRVGFVAATSSTAGHGVEDHPEISSGIAVPSTTAPAHSGTQGESKKGQDAFRAMLAGK